MNRGHRIFVSLCLLGPLAGGSVAASPAAVQPPRDLACKEWRDCRQLALAAADRAEYEAFHDLAWRAVQTGPRNDPALMYLLARAQSLSGRPHDALIMLQRLAQIGIASDASTNDDFIRTRQLPDWPELAARIAQIPDGARSLVVAPPRATVPAPAGAAPSAPSRAPVASPAAAAASAPVTAPVPAAKPSLFTPPAKGDVVRFSAERFAVGGVAYDAVSHRFLFGDRLGRKLIVVGDGSNHADDLVRGDSAGFQDISAVEIDSKRGDLWVASATGPDGAGTLHRLQLVSGRQLKAFRIAGDPDAVNLVDLAVTQAGAVLVLDATSRQLLVLRSGVATLERVLKIDAEEPASLAAGGDDGIAYVAHRDGVSRIDLRSRTASRVAAPKGVSLTRLERIRWRRNALIAVQVDGDGSRRIVRLDLNASGSAVRQATTLEVSVPAADQAFVTISGDELVYLMAGSKTVAGGSPDPSPGLAEFVAYRVPLR
jgi:hypothetical protein